jgi:hypothetical protein
MKKIYIVLIVLIGLALVRLVFVSNNQNLTGNGGNMTTPGTTGRANSCEDESISLYNNNDRKISSRQIDGGQISWKKDKYTWMVFNCPDESQSYTNVFMLTDKNNKILLTMEDERFDKPELKDINRDELPELIITHGSSGNCWNCQGQSIFKIVNGDIKDMFPDLPRIDGAKYSNLWLRDINNDKIEEIQVIDDSWENYEGFFHYNAPQRVLVLSWEDGEYLDNGVAFSKYYLYKITENNKAIKELSGNKDTTLNSIISLAVENFWNYQEMGKNDEAYANFILQTNLETLPKTITMNNSDKIWLLGIRNEIEKEYKEARPTIMPLY